ncbi:hypothetical protein ACFQ60_00205 [Streptomyces zhihengii]
MNGTDAVVLGYTGPADQPRQLVLKLPGGSLVLSQVLPEALARALATYLTGPGPAGRLPDGGPYTTIKASLIAEVASRPVSGDTVDVLRLH